MRKKNPVRNQASSIMSVCPRSELLNPQRRVGGYSPTDESAGAKHEELQLPRAAGLSGVTAWETAAERASFGSAEVSQTHQGILKKQWNLEDIDVRFTEIYRRVEHHGSIFWWG